MKNCLEQLHRERDVRQKGAGRRGSREADRGGRLAMLIYVCKTR